MHISDVNMTRIILIREGTPLPATIPMGERGFPSRLAGRQKPRSTGVWQGNRGSTLEVRLLGGRDWCKRARGVTVLRLCARLRLVFWPAKSDNYSRLTLWNLRKSFRSASLEFLSCASWLMLDVFKEVPV